MPTSRPPGRRPPSGPVARLSRPRVGPPRATMPRIPRPAARIVIDGARADVADDAGDRRLERIDDVAGRDAPARPPGEEVLAAVRAAPAAGLAGADDPADSVPAVARARLDRLGDHLVLEPRVAQALGDRGAHHDRGAGLDQRAVARRDREDRVDGRLDQAARRHELEVAGPASELDHRIAEASPGASRYPSGAPAAVCHASRSSRRRSARSGRRIGTSRRSTTGRPARRRRRPRSGGRVRRGGRRRGTELGGRRRARAAGPTISRPPGTRSIGLRLRGVGAGRRGRSWTTRLPALRPSRGRPA